MKEEVFPSSKLYRGLLYLMLLALMVEATSWLGLYVIGILMPETEIIPRTGQIYAKQSRVIEQLLESQITDGGESILILDDHLGWRYRENYDSLLQRINQQGVRSNREYDRVAANGITRVAVFGDSFAYGSEVSNTEAWSAQVEEMFPDLEVLNYAVPGFGTDQAYLRYMREGNSLAPQIVLIGFAPVNLRRAVNVYRRFLSVKEFPLVKPRFTLDHKGNLKLLAVPYKQASDYKRLLESPRLVKELGSNDQWYSAAVYENPYYDWSATVRLITNISIILHRKVLDPNRLLTGGIFGNQIFNSSSLAFRIQSMIFEKFHAAVLDSGSVPVVVFYPSKDDIYRSHEGVPTTYQPLVEFLNMQNMKYIDCIEAFIDLPGGLNIARLFAPGGHYSKEGNMLVAELVGNKISELVETGIARDADPRPRQ